LLARSHTRLFDLVESVLEVERLNAEQVQLHIEKISEGELLGSAMDAARKTAQAKGLLFEVHCTPEREVQTDVKLTRSAVQNLVDNAVKYTDAGRVEVVTSMTDTSWVLHVSDTCPGLSAEELRTIFKPFRRGKTAKKGTGLGLSIAKRAVEVQGGSIHAESPGPIGCHFWITLPNKPSEEVGADR
jgi:signal transduction histidine kinase